MTGATGEPGTIYTGNLPRAEATDTYTFRGDKGEETFEPFFTYHGFRYLEITGLDKPLPLENVTALLLMSDLDQTSEFDSSNALVNPVSISTRFGARATTSSACRQTVRREANASVGRATHRFLRAPVRISWT